MRTLLLLILIVLASCSQNQKDTPSTSGHYVPLQWVQGGWYQDTTVYKTYSAISFYNDDSAGGVSEGATLHRDGRLVVRDTMETIKQMLVMLNRVIAEKNQLKSDLELFKEAFYKLKSKSDNFIYISQQRTDHMGVPKFEPGTTIACVWSNCKQCKVKL
jgi:hypothetical protein